MSFLRFGFHEPLRRWAPFSFMPFTALMLAVGKANGKAYGVNTPCRAQEVGCSLFV